MFTFGISIHFTIFKMTWRLPQWFATKFDLFLNGHNFPLRKHLSINFSYIDTFSYDPWPILTLTRHLPFFMVTPFLLILQRTCNALWIRSGGPRRALYLGGCCQPLPGIPPNQPGSQPRRGCPSGPAPRDLGAWRHQCSLPLPSFEMKEAVLPLFPFIPSSENSCLSPNALWEW